ncbi:MAG: hypothetical protein HQK54_13395 [Oligoflexales bacterium]|nr:hypothetical protein [Oligoflexales bacterium]
MKKSLYNYLAFISLIVLTFQKGFSQNSADDKNPKEKEPIIQRSESIECPKKDFLERSSGSSPPPAWVCEKDEIKSSDKAVVLAVIRKSKALSIKEPETRFTENERYLKIGIRICKEYLKRDKIQKLMPMKLKSVKDPKDKELIDESAAMGLLMFSEEKCKVGFKDLNIKVIDNYWEKYKKSNNQIIMTRFEQVEIPQKSYEKVKKEFFDCLDQNVEIQGSLMGSAPLSKREKEYIMNNKDKIVPPEVEEYIKKRYPDSEKRQRALMQYAEDLINELLNADNRSESIKASTKSMTTYVCLKYIFGFEGRITEREKLTKLIINSKEKYQAFLKAEQNYAGQRFRIPHEEKEIKSTCRFDVDSMK